MTHYSLHMRSILRGRTQAHWAVLGVLILLFVAISLVSAQQVTPYSKAGSESASEAESVKQLREDVQALRAEVERLRALVAQ
jgi:uncharacterized protein YlxW (UPF0749 family)